MQPTIFVFGPSLTTYTVAAAAPVGDPAIVPGEIVNLVFTPAASPADALPVNAYAFFVPEATALPTGDALTPDWFFKSGAVSGSIHVVNDGPVAIPVSGVPAGVYFVQTILEFPSN
jgi:hypothetical protein